MKAIFRSVLLAGMLALPAALPHAAVSNRYYQVIDDVGIYLEIMPEASPQPEGQYRILVELFDRAAGTRLKDADVTATVLGSGQTGTQKKLELTVTTSSVTYGNRFNLPRPGPYRIQLAISRMKEHSDINLEFGVERPS